MSKRKPFSRRVHREVKFEAANTTFADERFAFEIGKQRQRAQNFMNNISICFLLFPFRKHIKKDISFLTSINERNEDLWRPFLCVLLMLLFRLLNYIYDHIYITSIFFFVKWKKKDGYGRWNERKSFLALMLMFFFLFLFSRIEHFLSFIAAVFTFLFHKTASCDVSEEREREQAASWWCQWGY